MYNRFFGFKERPFKLVPNPEYLYLSRIHEEVLAHLNYAVGYGDGFVEITGEVGTGKTTLCRMFLENLDENTDAAYIFNPKLDALELIKAINDEFGIPSDAETIKPLIDRLNAFLLEKKANGRRVILLVDEAQNLSADVLEQLRLLSNLETTTSKLLQIILVGQPELSELLETERLRQLNQRITLSCHLIPLTLAETRAYIRHRIHVASLKPGLDFSPSAYRTLFKYTGGVPRLINIACDRTLLTAFTLGKHRITNGVVRKAVRELDRKHPHRRRPGYRLKPALIGAAAVLVAIAGVMVLSRTMINRRIGPVAPVSDEASTKTDRSKDTKKDADTEPRRPLMINDLPSPPLPLEAVPEPAVETGTTDSAPSPRSPAIELEEVIGSEDAHVSRRGALRAILTAWKAPNQVLPAGSAEVQDNDVFFRVAARHYNLEVLRARGNLNLIRKLNLPAILEFPRPGGGIRFLAVVGLAEDKFRLSDGEVSFSVPTVSLAQRWNGIAHIFWKNHYNLDGVIPTGSSGEVILSLKMLLKALGFPMKAMTAAYDTTTRQAIETIQARHGLDVDGVVGPLTKIVLYNEDRSLDIPRLVENPPQ